MRTLRLACTEFPTCGDSRAQARILNSEFPILNLQWPSQSDQVQLDLRVAVFARPDVERRARDFVDERHGEPEPREVDAFQIVTAGVAGVDTKMIEIGGVEVSELAFVFFAAADAQHAADRPFGEAGRALQRAPAAGRERLVAAVKHGELRRAAAE